MSCLMESVDCSLLVSFVCTSLSARLKPACFSKGICGICTLLGGGVDVEGDNIICGGSFPVAEVAGLGGREPKIASRQPTDLGACVGIEPAPLCVAGGGAGGANCSLHIGASVAMSAVML